ncbi:GNAT family N-acetyltransferase [Pseudovibrio sp. Tun.PSC04-5.I4]|uniref:GNAT family N-acetyltransferase n=1 Tax=Pseudovibrio sp. Tun.PSC04-5.I4 TaxID=1798213 RepID=UPI001AD94E08|nr:GNAT family N-acetyltransferase [Pseudovibrio sp. Tun.PSC04-5.I4]
MHKAKGHWGYDPKDMELFCEHWKITPQMIEEDKILTITENTTPLGFVRVVNEGNGIALLDCLFVLPQAHGKGYGAWLLEGAEELAKRMNCNHLRLESDANAVPFYERHKYSVTSERPSAFKNAGDIRFMEKDLTPKIRQISSINLKLNTNTTWDFAVKNETAIQDHWQTLTQSNPDLWDGRVLSLYHYTFEAQHLVGSLVETNYSAFLAWRDWGFPDRKAKNLFGCTILRSSEGHLVFGKMASNTATAGQVYPPGGNLDLNDITETGLVDIHGSIARELEEETGFKHSDGDLGELIAVEDGPRLAIARVLTLPLTAEQILAKILHFNANQEKPELDEVVIVKTLSNLDAHNVPPHARRLAEHVLN